MLGRGNGGNIGAKIGGEGGKGGRGSNLRMNALFSSSVCCFKAGMYKESRDMLGEVL